MSTTAATTAATTSATTMPLSVGDGDDASFMSDVSDVHPDELEKMLAVS